tara:strand:+ start:582 stop:737 length:156 start_codon:yes stop_codon:yes gene_type:complete
MEFLLKYIDIIIMLVIFYGIFAPIAILSYLFCGRPKNKKKTPKNRGFNSLE